MLQRVIVRNLASMGLADLLDRAKGGAIETARLSKSR
jgi:hypothetical protein